MVQIYKLRGTNAGGIYFNRPDGKLGQTAVSQILVPGLAVGEKLLVHAETTVSLRAEAGIYVGWLHNTFTGSQLYLAREYQNHWCCPAADGNWIEVSEAGGQDISPGSATSDMQPYLHHQRTGMHEITADQEGDWWVVFDVWASCSYATGNSVAKNEYLLPISQQTGMSIMRMD